MAGTARWPVQTAYGGNAMPKLLIAKLIGLAATATLTYGMSGQARESPQDLAEADAPDGGEPA